LFDALVLGAALGVVLGTYAAACWWAYGAGYGDGRRAAAAERQPALDRARADAIAEMFAPVGHATCSVVGPDRVIARAPCARIAAGGWYVEDRP
jgi:hypothetical protein